MLVDHEQRGFALATSEVTLECSQDSNARLGRRTSDVANAMGTLYAVSEYRGLFGCHPCPVNT